MNQIKIRRPNINDKDDLLGFFKILLEDTFKKEGIEDLVEDLQEETLSKKKYLEGVATHSFDFSHRGHLDS